MLPLAVPLTFVVCHFSILQIKFREKSESKLVAGAEGTLHPFVFLPLLHEKSCLSADVKLSSSPCQTSKRNRSFESLTEPAATSAAAQVFYSIAPLDARDTPVQLREKASRRSNPCQTAGSAAPQGSPPNKNIHITARHTCLSFCSVTLFPASGAVGRRFLRVCSALSTHLEYDEQDPF